MIAERIVLSVITAAAVTLFVVQIVSTQAFAQCLTGPDCDKNPLTGNPHPQVIGAIDAIDKAGNPLGIETGNPHSQSCTGDPHSQTAVVDACQGSK